MPLTPVAPALDVDNDEQAFTIFKSLILMSAVDLQMPPSVVPERRRREPPEIIDLDALDVDDVVYVRSSPARQRRRVTEDGRSVPVTPEVIHIPDSDDDEEIQFVGRNPVRPQHPRRAPRERIFSPPPPPTDRWHSSSTTNPTTIPPDARSPACRPYNSQRRPFPFEADLRSAPRPAENPPAPNPPPVAAPASHHVPAMGFGGALLAGVRQVMRPPSEGGNERPARRTPWGFPSSVIMRWDPFDFFGAEGEDALDDLDELAVLGGCRHSLRCWQKYTHPNKPLPGFTHGFAPSSSSASPPSSVIVLDDSPGASSASTSSSQSGDASLVCASCCGPLILGASDVAEGRNQRRLWGLHCGHLLDGKCIEKLMKPAPPASDQAQTPSRVDVKMGPWRVLLPRSILCVHVYALVVECLDPSLPPHSYPTHYRQARIPGVAGGTAARPQVTHRGKGKGKAKVPIVEAEHEWGCPVSGCGQVHLSLLVDGRWMMDEKRGAIAVFV
ncbi:hypothetical protein BU15DRAFT_75223 [Melanogaster broomeanus]|nr:hypothetical protein BU15DRAFT_75223 [Melanogaster broomeanus]